MEKVATFFGNLQFPSSRIEEIKTVVSEAILNAIEHGNKFNESKSVSMTIESSGNIFLLIVEDFGDGISGDLNALKKEKTSAHEIGRRGLGLYFISQFSDNISSQICNKKHVLKIELSR